MITSKWFSPQEFACKDGCGEMDVADRLVEILDEVREHFGQQTLVLSGRRCATHNANVGGAKRSQHLYGNAADIKVKGSTPKEVADYIEEVYGNEVSIGRYKTFTHVDVRPGKPARWGSN